MPHNKVGLPAARQRGALAATIVTLAGATVLLGAQPAPGAGATGQNPPDRQQATFPAQQRPPGDPAVIARGRALYGINCRGCHGIDLRGGDMGGPNLLRSRIVLSDQHGELLLPVIRDGRSSPGMPFMPPQSLSEDEVRSVAEYIHSVTATAERQGAPPPGPSLELNVLVGDAAAGRAYFAARCRSCHSETGDLKGIGTRIANPKQLQNTWVRGGPAAVAGRTERASARVLVTLQSGERVEGRLDRLDDFIVSLTQADGRQRSFSRRGPVPKVEISDPMAAHTDLLPVYRDKDIHDVTAYLVTLK
jgi:cytochrome c oxidase cbb3-type subunit 3